MAFNVGNLSFNITGNTAGLQKAVNELNAFSKVVDKVAKSQQEGAANVVKAYAAQERAIKSALTTTLNLRQRLQAAGAPAEMFARITNAFTGLSNSLTKGQADTLKFTRSQDQFRLIMGQVTRDLKKFQAAQAESGSSKFSDFLKNIQSSAILAAGPLSGISSRIAAFGGAAERSSLSMATFLVGTTALSLGIGFLSKAAVEASIELQKFQGVMLASAGSTTAANLEFKYIHEEAIKLGLSINSLAMNYATLSAATKGTSLAGQKTRDIFEAVATTSSALRMSTEEVNGVMLAFTQMVSMGKVRSQELVTQLAQHIPGTMQLAAQATGKTTAELRKMMEEGTLLTSDFLPKLAALLQKTFGTAAATQAQSLTGSISNLKTVAFDFLTNFDKTVGVSNAFKNVVEVTTSSLRYLSTNMGNVIALLGALTGATAAFMIVMKWSAIVTGWQLISKAVIAYSAAAKSATLITVGLNAALSGGISLLIRLGVAAAGAAAGYALMAPSVESASEATKNLIDSTKELTKNSLSAAPFQQQAQLIRDQINLLQNKMDSLKTSTSTGLGQSLDRWAQRFGGKSTNDKLTEYQNQINQLNDSLKELDETGKQLSGVAEPIAESEAAVRALAQAIKSINALRTEAASLASGQSEREANQAKQVQQMTDTLKDAAVAQEQINKVTAEYASLLQKVEQLKSVREVDTKITEMQSQYNSLLINTSEAEGKRAKDIEKIRQALIASGNAQDVVNQKTSKYASILEKVSQQTALNSANEQLKQLRQETSLYASGFDSEMVSMQQEVYKYSKALKDAGVDNDTVASKTAAYTQALVANKRAAAEVTAANKAIDDTFSSITDALVEVSTNAKTVSEAFSDMVQNIIKSLTKMLVQELITTPLSNALKTALGLTTNAQTTGSSGLTDWFSKLLGFASGGSVQKNQPIRVGETGEELFVPNSNGTILSNSDLNNLGSSNVTHVAMNVYTTDVRGFQSSRKQIAAKMWDAVNAAQGIR